MRCYIIESLKLRSIDIPNDLSTFEYHKLLAYLEFKFDVNPSKVEYKYACDKIREILS